MGKKSLLAISLIIIAIVVVLAIENKNIAGSFLGIKKTSAENSASIPTMSINYGNIEQVFSGSSLIKDLPEGGIILLRFYNFNTGEKQWEKSYILKKGEVKEGYTDKADIVVAIHSKYLEQLTNKNFCSVIQTAKKNGDLGIESKLSTAKLLWKFKGMLNYRECLGF